MSISFKSGFIAIVGSPNVGKSTIVNQIVGEKVSIVSPKPQTTRSAVRGILTTDEYQMILLDTPGLVDPKNMLNRSMMRYTAQSMNGVDVLVFVLDAVIGLRRRDQENLKNLMRLNVPMYIIINKIDLTGKEMINETVNAVLAEGFEGKIFMTSALNNNGVSEVLEELAKRLPEGPKYYPEDMYTDSPERFIAAEIIREKALYNLNEEVPHGVGIEIEKCLKRSGKELMDIHAAIYCEKRSHKNIIVGARGAMIKKIGTESREDLEMLFGMKVYLELFVKVREDWRNSASVLKTLGYE